MAKKEKTKEKEAKEIKAKEAREKKAEARKETKEKKAEAKKKPLWFKRSNEEIEALVVKLGKQGLSPAKIGLVLRDSYGVPSVRVSGKKIGKILFEHGIKAELLSDLVKRALALRKHLDKNAQDKVAKRGLQLTEAKISKLAAYYKRKGLLLKNWKYKQA